MHIWPRMSVQAFRQPRRRNFNRSFRLARSVDRSPERLEQFWIHTRRLQRSSSSSEVSSQGATVNFGRSTGPLSSQVIAEGEIMDKCERGVEPTLTTQRSYWVRFGIPWVARLTVDMLKNIE